MDDGFRDTGFVDLTRTTARVDTTNHYILLPWQSLAGAIDMLDSNMGFAVASQDGVTLYEYDAASGKVVPNTLYSCPWATDATGVSIRQDNLNIWAVTGDSVACYRFSGAGMADDPALKVSGLTDVLSVSSFKDADTALVLQSEGNKAIITRYEAGANLGPTLVFKPDIADPVKISMVGSSPDFVLFTKNAAYYFSYDDSGGTYVEDPAKKIAGLAGVVSGSGDGTGNSIVTEAGADYYINADTGGSARVDVFSPGPVSRPVSVSLRAGTYEQVFLDENGSVEWWCFDDSLGRMVRDPGLEINVPGISRGYTHPREYFSGVQASEVMYDAARLKVTEDRPAGTTISYAVSSDGGLTFTPVTPGEWTALPGGSRFVVRAALDTSDAGQTPKILRVTLEALEDMVLEGRVTPCPAERGRNVTIMARAVSLSTGVGVPLDSCRVTYPLEFKAGGGPALADGKSPADVGMVFNESTGYWDHTFTVPAREWEGRWPDDGVYRVRISGTRGGVKKDLLLNLEISGNILGRLIIRSLSW